MKFPIHDRKFLFLLLSVISVVTLEVLKLVHIEIPRNIAPFVFAPIILAIGYHVLWEGVKALVKVKFTSINLLMLIAVIGAFYLKEYEEAAVVIVLYVLSETLEDLGIASSKSAMNKLIESTPKTVIADGFAEPIPIDKVQPGTVIQIKPGDIVPLDGVIIEGNTYIDEATITGEPIPKDKKEGDQVFGNTLNKNGFIKVKTSRSLSETMFSRIVQITFEATKNKSHTQQFIEKFSGVYTPSIIVIAALLFIVQVFILHKDFNHWLNQAISVLVIACPCALVISTPVAIYAAIGNASKKGAVIKGGKFIEALARIKILFLDKTRTITYGNPIVADIIPLNDTSREELLADAAGAELFSEHPLAEAIIAACKKEGIEPHKVDKFESIAGKGAKADCLVCEDETILIGKLDFIAEHEQVTRETEDIVEKLSQNGKTSVVVSLGKGVAGVIGLTDEIKPDSKGALKEIEELNVEPIMLTGDSEKAAKFVAEQVGIKRIYGGLLPEHKAKKIKELVTSNTISGMVGDGVNDAPSLALANVGIAMGGIGSDTAIETADVVLMNDKLSVIPYLIRLSRKALKRIRMNTAAAILIKIVFLVFAFLGMSNLVFAIAADVGVTVIVILTSLSLMQFRTS